ncbi:MAG: hypothetical protein Q7U18_11440, partial [Methylobacter sp.]|nr:hypothetical protein [Methylobacter sp.]MDO9169681.1 hypothetical protein [Methylobacter sp.]
WEPILTYASGMHSHAGAVGTRTAALYDGRPRQLLLRCSTSCIIHRDVVNADIAGSKYLSMQVVPDHPYPLSRRRANDLCR